MFLPFRFCLCFITFEKTKGGVCAEWFWTMSSVEVFLFVYLNNHFITHLPSYSNSTLVLLTKYVWGISEPENFSLLLIGQPPSLFSDKPKTQYFLFLEWAVPIMNREGWDQIGEWSNNEQSGQKWADCIQPTCSERLFQIFSSVLKPNSY